MFQIPKAGNARLPSRLPLANRIDFNPKNLFANSEPGVWFEANDANTLFTDVAGTTPVTAPGDAVALQLDKSQGLVRKRDLIPNTGNPFVNTDDWAITLAGTTASIVGGRFRVESGGSGGRVTTSITGLVVGETVFVTISDLTVVGSPRVRVTTNSDGITGTILTKTPGTGDNSYSFIATQETMYLSVLNVTANTGVTEFGGATVEAIPGNHRTQATTAARPLYALHPVGGVRNKLEYTEEFDNAVWVKTLATISANSATAPDDESTADKLVEAAALGLHSIRQFRPANAGTYTVQVFLKAGGRTRAAVAATKSSGGGTYSVFNLSTGQIDEEGTDFGTGVTFASNSITDVGGGWYLCTIKAELNSATDFGISVNLDNATSGSLSQSYTGDGTSGIFIWGAQLEEGSTATNYQRVGSFLDVSEEGKARRGRLWYNGTSHFMETGTITPGTDKAQVFAGVRKLSEVVSTIAELGTNVGAINGSFGLFASLGNGANYEVQSRGTAFTFARANDLAAPTTNTITALGDISGDSAIIRVDGILKDTNTDNQGTGNYLAYPLYFGARAGTSLFFNGYEDTSIIRFGPNLDDTTISKVESYVASKTPASELFIPGGPELVTNGTFNTDVSGWDEDANGTISWDNGTLKYTGTGAGPTFMDVSQTLSTIVGQRYRVSFELTALSPTNPIRCVVTGTSDVITVNDSGVAVGDFIATNTSTIFQIGIVGGVLGETFNIDNVSVRQFIPK